MRELGLTVGFDLEGSWKVSVLEPASRPRGIVRKGSRTGTSGWFIPGVVFFSVMGGRSRNNPCVRQEQPP